MKTILLSPEEILQGYDAVTKIYPPVPSLYIWRAWEYAGSRRYALQEPVLDIGCGDGQFFHLSWPSLREAAGVDIDPETVDRARKSGFYREVQQARADRLPFASESFRSALANCSLEHMDRLPRVLDSIRRCLAPQGGFLLSVVTDKLIEWTVLPALLNLAGRPEEAKSLQRDYEEFHHYRNVFPPEVWAEYLENSGFQVLECVPIVPEMTARLFLGLDQIWHVPYLQGEFGDVLASRFLKIPNFAETFRPILSAILQMERNWSETAGAIFWAQKK